MDVYGYCLDDPVNLVDPLGLKTCINARDGIPGHAWIDIGCDGSVGKYPASSLDILGGDAAYKIEEQEPDVTVEFQTSRVQEQAMQAAQEREFVQNGRYNLVDNNCVTHANKVAKEGGIGVEGGQEWTLPHDYIREVNARAGGGGAGVESLSGKKTVITPQK